MQINHQSQIVIQMPVIYHHGNKVIALWCNSSAHEICFTFENSTEIISDLHPRVNIL